jgi:hypothetical protein
MDLLEALSYGARKKPLLGKHIPVVTHSTIESRLLSNERLVATDEREKNRGTVRRDGGTCFFLTYIFYC